MENDVLIRRQKLQSRAGNFHEAVCICGRLLQLILSWQIHLYPGLESWTNFLNKVHIMSCLMLMLISDVGTRS